MSVFVWARGSDVVAVCDVLFPRNFIPWNKKINLYSNFYRYLSVHLPL